jgi:hypothetical protein
MTPELPTASRPGDLLLMVVQHGSDERLGAPEGWSEVKAPWYYRLLGRFAWWRRVVTQVYTRRAERRNE